VITPGNWITEVVCARIGVVTVDFGVLAARYGVTPVVGALVVVIAVHSLDDTAIALPL